MSQQGKTPPVKRHAQYQTGKTAEQLARQYLQNAGLHLVAQNFSCRLGEIDLIMRDGATTVFIEVRYRDKNHFGGAVESIDYRKQKKLINTALFYLQSQQSLNNERCRFDVIAITRHENNFAVEWIKDAFGAQ